MTGLGLLYTTLDRDGEQVMIPNSVVLSSAVIAPVAEAVEAEEVTTAPGRA